LSRETVNGTGGYVVRGENSLAGKLQFSLVYEKSKSWAGKEVVVRAIPNELSFTRFGFTVSRRVGKAVIRNHVKRLLREIVRKLPVKTGWDIVLIARIPAAVVGYEELNRSVSGLLHRAGLLLGENESNSPGTN
jgi:ribonuclease P protein component